MIYGIALAIILICFVVPQALLCRGRTKQVYTSFKWLRSYTRRKLPYSVTADIGMGEGLRLCPHPFTNWSLNPAFCNALGERIHTAEGFRRTSGSEFELAGIKERPDACAVLCVGGGATYCSGIDRTDKTWPALLRGILSRDRDAEVINCGVPGWNSMQSLIRCLAWLPLLRPQTVIMYQAKNDLEILSQVPDTDEAVFPDHQNAMCQYAQALEPAYARPLLYVPFFALLEVRRLSSLDRSPCGAKSVDARRVKRLATEDVIEGIVFRAEAIAAMCASIGCAFIYVPEITTADDEIQPLYETVYNRVRDRLKRYDNAFYRDIRTDMPADAGYFIDGNHLSEEGCGRFAGLMAQAVRACAETGVTVGG